MAVASPFISFNKVYLYRRQTMRENIRAVESEQLGKGRDIERGGIREGGIQVQKLWYEGTKVAAGRFERSKGNSR